MKQLFFILIAISFLAFLSCKKDKEDDDPTKTTAQKILGKWQINNISINDHISGEDNIRNYPGTPADYVDFKTDGKMHTYFRGALNVSDYTVIGVKTITISKDDATIKQLTDATLIFSSRDNTGSIGFTEVIYDLKR